MVTAIIILTANFTINNWQNIKLFLPKSENYIKKQTSEFLCEKKVAQILVRTQSKLILIKKSASFGNINYHLFKNDLMLELKKELAKMLKKKGLKPNDVLKTKKLTDDYKNNISTTCYGIYENKNLESLLKLFFNILQEM